jgi:hypothetical protein
MQNRKAPSFKPLTISAQNLPVSMAEQADKMDYAAERARLLLGCYRTGDANDPETYVTAIAAVLAKYPDAVITAVTDPRIGLPRKKTWLPSIKEVYDACDAEYEPMREEIARQDRIKRQLRERADLEEAPRPTLEQLKAKYGKNWGISDPEEAKREIKPAPTAEQLRHHYQYYDLAFKPKNQADLEDHINSGFSPGSV